MQVWTVDLTIYHSFAQLSDLLNQNINDKT